MLFKFTFVPNIDITERKILGDMAGRASEEDSQEMMQDIFSSVHNSEYNVFVYGTDLIDATRKLNSWFDDESCILNHPAYDRIVMNMLVECIDPTDNRPVLLNSLSVIN